MHFIQSFHEVSLSYHLRFLFLSLPWGEEEALLPSRLRVMH